eukprot:Nk52_evm4s478 gene=Nk52_evmTU4s478
MEACYVCDEMGTLLHAPPWAFAASGEGGGCMTKGKCPSGDATGESSRGKDKGKEAAIKPCGRGALDAFSQRLCAFAMAQSVLQNTFGECVHYSVINHQGHLFNGAASKEQTLSAYLVVIAQLGTLVYIGVKHLSSRIGWASNDVKPFELLIRRQLHSIHSLFIFRGGYRSIAQISRMTIFHVNDSAQRQVKNDILGSTSRTLAFLIKHVTGLADSKERHFAMEQSFLLQACERLEVNDDIRGIGIEACSKAWKLSKKLISSKQYHVDDCRVAENSTVPSVDADIEGVENMMVFVGNKVLCLFSAKNAPMVSQEDLLRLSLFVPKVFDEDCTKKVLAPENFAADCSSLSCNSKSRYECSLKQTSQGDHRNVPKDVDIMATSNKKKNTSSESLSSKLTANRRRWCDYIYLQYIPPFKSAMSTCGGHPKHGKASSSKFNEEMSVHHPSSPDRYFGGGVSSFHNQHRKCILYLCEIEPQIYVIMIAKGHLKVSQGPEYESIYWYANAYMYGQMSVFRHLETVFRNDFRPYCDFIKTKSLCGNVPLGPFVSALDKRQFFQPSLLDLPPKFYNATEGPQLTQIPSPQLHLAHFVYVDRSNNIFISPNADSNMAYPPSCKCRSHIKLSDRKKAVREMLIQTQLCFRNGEVVSFRISDCSRFVYCHSIWFEARRTSPDTDLVLGSCERSSVGGGNISGVSNCCAPYGGYGLKSAMTRSTEEDTHQRYSHGICSCRQSDQSNLRLDDIQNTRGYGEIDKCIKRLKSTRNGIYRSHEMPKNQIVVDSCQDMLLGYEDFYSRLFAESSASHIGPDTATTETAGQSVSSSLKDQIYDCQTSACDHHAAYADDHSVGSCFELYSLFVICPHIMADQNFKINAGHVSSYTSDNSITYQLEGSARGIYNMQTISPHVYVQRLDTYCTSSLHDYNHEQYHVDVDNHTDDVDRHDTAAGSCSSTPSPAGARGIINISNDQVKTNSTEQHLDELLREDDLHEEARRDRRKVGIQHSAYLYRLHMSITETLQSNLCDSSAYFDHDVDELNTIINIGACADIT